MMSAANGQAMPMLMYNGGQVRIYIYMIICPCVECGWVFELRCRCTTCRVRWRVQRAAARRRVQRQSPMRLTVTPLLHYAAARPPLLR
jgi:hypothetical protein